MPWGVAAAAIGVVGAGISAEGASSAAGAQSGAAKNAAAQNLAMYQNGYNTLNPYVQLGNNAYNQLTDDANGGALYSYANYRSPYLTQAGQNVPGQINLPNAPNLPSAPQPMTQAQLEATPGYQFNLSQGLKATQSAAAAKGLGVSGAALKGAATYATGLADSTYQNQFANAQQIYSDMFNNAQQNYTNQFNTAQQGFTNQQQRYGDYLNLGSQDMANRQNQVNSLLNAAGIGENAAAQTGNQGIQSAANTGNFLTQAGQAQAAGSVGTANALTGALGGTFNQLQGQQNLYNYTGGQAGSNINGLLSGIFGGGSSPSAASQASFNDFYGQPALASGSSAY
jgi:hypothetical protein